MVEKIQNYFKEQIAGKLVENKYEVEMSDESMEKVEYVKKMIEKDENLNLLVYFNHVSFDDPLLAGHIVTMIDPNNTRKVVAPISYSHTEVKLKNMGILSINILAKMCGVETRRVIQTYQVDSPEHKYTKDKADKVGSQFFSRLKELKKKNIPTCLLISPEGHRSDDGLLEKGEEGMALCGTILSPVLYVPVGVIYENNFNRSSLNFGKKVTLNIGDIYEQNSKERRGIIFPKLMTNLANALPEEMRGAWSKNLTNLPEARK